MTEGYTDEMANAIHRAFRSWCESDSKDPYSMFHQSVACDLGAAAAPAIHHHHESDVSILRFMNHAVAQCVLRSQRLACPAACCSRPFTQRFFDAMAPKQNANQDAAQQPPPTPPQEQQQHGDAARTTAAGTDTGKAARQAASSARAQANVVGYLSKTKGTHEQKAWSTPLPLEVP